MNKNLKENSKKIGISISYLSEILNGKKGCSEAIMKLVKELYPELNFTLLNPRYIVKEDSDE